MFSAEEEVVVALVALVVAVVVVLVAVVAYGQGDHYSNRRHANNNRQYGRQLHDLLVAVVAEYWF